MLEPADVLDRLDDRFRLLTDGWSHRDPPPADAARDARLELRAARRGRPGRPAADVRLRDGGSTGAVEAVCGEEDIDAVEAVVRLADRSLAFSTVGPDGRSRFGLLDTVREYGRVQLRASGEEEAIARRHVSYWTTFAAGAFALRDEDRDEQADALEREIGELRLALDRAHAMIGGEELALTGLLGWFWLHHTHLTEGRQLLERALSRPDGDELQRARCLCVAGAMGAMQGDAAGASERFEAGLAILRRRGAVAEECVALDDRGWGLFFLGDVPGAEAAFERAVLLADRAAVPGLVRRANTGLCQMLVARGDVERARPLARQLMRIAGGDLWTEHLAHHFLADVALMEGDPAEALGWYRTALELAHRMGNAAETGIELQGVAMAAAGVGDPELAIRMNGAAEAALERVGLRHPFGRLLGVTPGALPRPGARVSGATRGVDRPGRAVPLARGGRPGGARAIGEHRGQRVGVTLRPRVDRPRVPDLRRPSAMLQRRIPVFRPTPPWRTDDGRTDMDDSTTEAVARRWHQDIYLRGRLDVADEICSPGLVAHGTGVAPDAPTGPRFVREDAAGMREAFDILAITDDDVFSSGDRVAIRWTFRGSHVGPFLGVEGTGRQVHVTGMDIFRMDGDRIAEFWTEFNLMDLAEYGRDEI